MRIQDTFEYKLVKQITAKENRRNIIKTILQAFALVAASFGMMYMVMWVMLAIWYA